MADDKPHPISVDDLERLGINDRHELFWDGKRVEVRSLIDLTWTQTAAAILVGAAAICGGFASAANDGTEFTCRQWHVFCGHDASAKTASQAPTRE